MYNLSVKAVTDCEYMTTTQYIHFLHACKKQKGKAEQYEIDTAVKRAKEKGFTL